MPTDRAALIEKFIGTTDWADAARTTLAGDASARRYDRLALGGDGGTSVLMDADPARGEDVRPFISVAKFLTGTGLSAPRILAADEPLGALIIEDFGDDLFARHLERTPDDAAALYDAAIDALVALHNAPAPVLNSYAPVMPALSGLAYEWYLNGVSGTQAPDHKAQTEAEMARLVAQIGGPEVVILRDYHAENLIWLPDRKGPARVGLLDFQDAMLGPAAYDVISLTTDARRDVSPEIARAMLARYIAASNQPEDAFLTSAAICAAQRNLRILGVFARLGLRDGKAHYIDLIPRVWGHLVQSLEHPALRALADRIFADLPAPTPDLLAKLKAQCAKPQTP